MELKWSPLILSMIVVITSQGMLAADSSNDAQTTAKSKKAAATSIGKKTVGELLRQNDRGSALQVSKGQTSLPQFDQKLFDKKVGGGGEPDLRTVKPPRASNFMQDRSNDDKVKLERITDQQIRELYKMADRMKDSPRRGEMWLRLAELYVEKAGLIDFRKQSEYDVKLRAFHAGKAKQRPVLNLADAQDYNKKAIQLYEWFVRDFPKDEKMDQALFFLGYNYFELNQIEKGLSYYGRLTTEYPNSPFVTESHFALAEYYFEGEKWQLAEQHYEEVTKHKNHRLYSFSMYKQAWCFYRLGHNSQALNMMERLIKENREAAQSEMEGKKVSKARLEKEGLRDIVLFYADEGRPEGGPDYFNRIAGADSLGYIEKLGYLYVDKGNREGAKFIFSYLISRYPLVPKAFDYKYQIIQVYSNATKTREFREELYSWVKDFGPSGAWYQANVANKELMESSSKLRETTLKNWVLTQHQTAQNSHAKFSEGLAYEGYKVYIQEFPNSAAAPDMHFFFAELLYDMERFDEAGIQYRWVVDSAPQSKYGGKAAENIVLALEKNIPKDDEIAATVGKSLDPVDFSPKVDKFVQVAQWYLNKFPNTPKSAEIKFRVGRLYYQHSQFEKAVPYFRDIVKNYPKTKYSEYSANLLLDIFNLKKDYAGLEKAGQELLAVPTIANSTAGSDIRGVLERAQFKKAQSLEAVKDYNGSAEQYEAFAAQNAKSPLAVVAYFNAAINYERANNNAKAITDHKIVLASHDKEAEALKPKSKRIIGKLYQDAGMLEEAAMAYKNSALEAGKDLLGLNLFYDAAILNEAIGRNRESLEDFQIYFDKSRNADRTEAVFAMAEIYRREGRLKAAVDHYKEYYDFGLQKEHSVEAAFRIYEHYKSLQMSKESDIWSHKVLGTQRRLNPAKKGVGATWAARVLLDQATLAFYEMKSIRIPHSAEAQQKAVQQKLERLNDLNKRLAEVIKFDSPEEIVGALNLLGRANEHIADAITSAPVPAGLKPDELKQYKDGIQKVADPFAAKAVEVYHTALDRSSELEVYSKERDYARDALHRLEPSQNTDHNEIPLETISMAWEIQ